MKAVFISDVSPTRGHIYGLRFSSLARAMAGRGHRVVVLSPVHADRDNPIGIAELPATLAGHDWSQPLMMTARPARAALVDLSRRQGVPSLLRRGLTGYLLAIEGGVHGDWERGARPLARALAEEFRPDIVWPVFGNASSMVIAQKLAARAVAVWLPDIKDNWEAYTPPAVRPLLRRRFADAAGFTTNAELHGDIAERWLGRKGHVVYSGVADAMAAPSGARARGDVCQFALVGSTYRPEVVARFLSVFRGWLTTLGDDERARIRLRYCGSSESVVRSMLDAQPLPCPVEVTGNVPHAELAGICQGAAANCYLWAPFTFHHKMLELLSTGRPAISFPGEHDESVRLAAGVGGELVVCRSEAELHAAFERTWRRWSAGDRANRPVDLSAYSWDAGAAKLEAVFEAAIARHRSRSG